MIPGDLLPWLALVSSLLAVGGTIWTMMTSPAKAVADRLDKVEAQVGATLDRLEERAAALELRVAQMPSTDALHSLALTVESMRGETREMRALMVGAQQLLTRLEAIVSRHEDHLLGGRN